MAASDAMIVGVMVDRRYIVGIAIMDWYMVILTLKKRSINVNCVQNIIYRKVDREARVSRCFVLICDSIASDFFILGVLILSVFIYLDMVGIEKTRIALKKERELANKFKNEADELRQELKERKEKSAPP